MRRIVQASVAAAPPSADWRLFSGCRERVNDADEAGDGAATCKDTSKLGGLLRELAANSTRVHLAHSAPVCLRSAGRRPQSLAEASGGARHASRPTREQERLRQVQPRRHKCDFSKLANVSCSCSSLAFCGASHLFRNSSPSVHTTNQLCGFRRARNRPIGAQVIICPNHQSPACAMLISARLTCNGDRLRRPIVPLR